MKGLNPVKLYQCVYCGEEKLGKELTKDHFIPKSKGGRKMLNNAIIACKPCNMVKGNRIYSSVAQGILDIRRKKQLIIEKYGSLENRFRAL